MMRRLLLLIIVTFTIANDDLPPDKSQWKDPNDMLAMPTVSTINRRPVDDADDSTPIRSLVPTNDDATAQTCESMPKYRIDPTLKLILRQLLHRLNIDSDSPSQSSHIFTATVGFSADEIGHIREYLESNIPDVTSHEHVRLHEHVRSAMKNFIREVSPTQSSSDDNDYSFLATVSVKLLIFPIALVIGQQLLMLRRRSFMLIVGSCLFALFCYDCHATWWRLYLVCGCFYFIHFIFQEKQAENAARSEQTRTDCFSGMTFWRSIGSSLKSLWYKQPDVCQQYFKDAMIDPRYQVLFTLAITTTITESFLGPLEIVGKSLSKFISAFYDIPPMLAPIATMLLILFGLTVLLLRSQYRFRIFGIFTLEPGAPTVPSVTANGGEYVEQQQPMIQQQQQQQPIRDIAESSTTGVSTVSIVELPDESPPPPPPSDVG